MDKELRYLRLSINIWILLISGRITGTNIGIYVQHNRGISTEWLNLWFFLSHHMTPARKMVPKHKHTNEATIFAMESISVQRSRVITFYVLQNTKERKCEKVFPKTQINVATTLNTTSINIRFHEMHWGMYTGKRDTWTLLLANPSTHETLFIYMD